MQISVIVAISYINLVEKVIRKAIEEFQDNSFAKVISKLNEKHAENL